MSEDRELALLRLAQQAFEERVQKLEEALAPFLTFSSSEEFITVQLRTAWIKHARTLVAPRPVDPGRPASEGGYPFG